HVVVLLSEVKAEAQLVSGNELRYFFCDSIQPDHLLSRRRALASHLLCSRPQGSPFAPIARHRYLGFTTTEKLPDGPRTRFAGVRHAAPSIAVSLDIAKECRVFWVYIDRRGKY